MLNLMRYQVVWSTNIILTLFALLLMILSYLYSELQHHHLRECTLYGAGVGGLGLFLCVMEAMWSITRPQGIMLDLCSWRNSDNQHSHKPGLWLYAIIRDYLVYCISYASSVIKVRVIYQLRPSYVSCWHCEVLRVLSFWQISF